MKITKKKVVIGAAIISGTVLLASCGKTTTATELRIVDQCTPANDLCEFELTDAVVSRYTNILGKTIERVESKTPLHDIQGTITWNAPSTAGLADNATVKSAIGVSCQDDNCTANSNPTAYNLAAGSNTISVSGTVTVDGKTIDLATDVQPDVVETVAVENSHTFQSGNLPSGSTITNLAAALNENKTKANGTFSADGTALKITCDSGYKWREDIDPAFGQEVNSDYNRGVSWVKWDTNSSSYTVKQGQDTAWTMNAVQRGDNITEWKFGCWKDESSSSK
ncbi:DUF3281 family protein [Francisella tularensis subsp. novicida]|uniref:DUF3281 family protein n=1 Tax=Francisella tularensis TaxID=263 RepID=UPI0008FD2138|nr:DUF3281 family protein [Francisella tularensis]APC94498.1 hypothetical protein KX02_668 [Francisella tularensis subsp. novicida]MBK2346322.1 DUF3281 family protein [Francisella tularensis subsp. novicida]